MTCYSDTDLNTPTNARHHDRPQWRQETGRGVVVYAEDVRASKDVLMPRVVIRGKASVHRVRDVFVLGPIGSRDDYLTVTFRPCVQVTTGCLTDSLEQFEREVAMKLDDLHRREYEAAIALIKVLVETRGGNP